MVINLGSPSFSPYDSYGRLARELAGGLAALGYHVNCFGGEAPDQIVKLAFGGLLLGYPTLFEQFGPANRGTRVALTSFESTKLPPRWPEILNTCAAVMVPSRWVVDTFRANGVTVPMAVVPHGISDVFKQVQRRDPAAKPFTFIAYTDRGWRKGWWHALQAFSRAFGTDTNYRLILKGRHLGALKPIQNANIEVLDGDYTDAQLVELYHRCHVMIAANCAEGFGFLPREFAATGGLALATNWGGTADELQWWGLPIHYHLDTAWVDDPEWCGQMGRWAEPDVDGLAAQLRFVADYYASYQDFMIRAAGFVASYYRWPLSVKQVLSVWNEVQDASHRPGAQSLPA